MRTRSGITALLLLVLGASFLLILSPQVMPTAIVAPPAGTPSAATPIPEMTPGPTSDVPTPYVPTPTFVVAPEPPCLASNLQAHGGRQGESGTANGEVVVTNVGQPCNLSGDPVAIELLGNGTPLPVVAIAPEATPGPAVTLPIMASADLGVDWANWCGPRPESVQIRITLTNTGGVLTSGFDGPPGYDYVPRCDQPSSPSVLQLLWTFTRVDSPGASPSYQYVGFSVIGSSRYSLEIEGMSWTIGGPLRGGWVAVSGDASAVVQVRSLPDCALVLHAPIRPGSAWEIDVTPRSARAVDIGRGGDLAGFAGPGRPPACPPLAMPSATDAQP